MELLHHLKHPHPLVLSEEKYDNTFECMVCRDCVAGLCYCCNECIFVVHKWCAELPLEITNHPRHSDHPRLVLLSDEERARVWDTLETMYSEDESSDDDMIVAGRKINKVLQFMKKRGKKFQRTAKGDSSENSCKKCGNEISISYAFSCEKCSFVLHPECALLPKQLQFEYNDVDSLPVRKRLRFKKRSWMGRIPCQLCKEGLGKSWFAVKNDHFNLFHIQCALLPKMVKHDRHIHDLSLYVPIEKEKSYYGCVCDLCEEDRDLNQWLYYCAKCEVAGHLSCGLLGSVPPNKAILTSNRIYTVQKEEPQVNDDSEEYKKALQKRVEREPGDTEPLGELVHFSHKHPLFLYDEGWHGLNRCRACKICIYGKIYVCVDCKFFLHKWCAELPKEVHFGFHFEHPLTLLSTHSFACSYCRLESDAFSFCCLECNFEVHTTCAFLFEFGVHKSHVHPLQVLMFTARDRDRGFIGKIPVRSRTMPPCNACLFPCEGKSLGCEECGFYLHIGCSLYPPTGKAKAHRHNLNLTYSYQEDPSYDEFICDACEKSRTPNCWVYCCPDRKCEIVSHLDCAVPNLFLNSSCDNERDPNDWVYYRPSPSLHLLHGLGEPGFDQPIQRILKSDPVYASLRDKVSENKPKVEELQHFSHKHPLVLSNQKWNFAVRCEACNRGIYGKTYSCHECGYYLHKFCAQIPREMQFRVHPEHPLILLPSREFECSVCEIKNLGFSFSCETCDFEAHTLCVLMPDRDLENHKHPTDVVFYTTHDSYLVTTCAFPVENGHTPQCNACRFPCEGMTMECKLCDFYLHVGCAWFPRTSKTESHMHTLTLDEPSDFLVEVIKFSNKKNPVQEITISDRSLCDVCDKALTPRCWGYICLGEECNTTAAHVDCAVPNLFLTSSFESILVHPDE